MHIFLFDKGKNCVLSQKSYGSKYQSRPQNFLPSYVSKFNATNAEEERAVLQQQRIKDFSKVEFQESQDIAIKKFSSSVLSGEKMKLHKN